MQRRAYLSPIIFPFTDSSHYPRSSFCILWSSFRVLVSVIQAVIGFLVLVFGFYLQLLSPLMLQALFAGLFDLVFRRKKTRKIRSVADRPDSLRARHPKVDKSEIKVSNVVAAMDGRLVQLEISFGEGFYHHRMAIAWVKKPRAG